MNEKDNKKANKKRLIIAAISLTVILAVTVTAYAWFTNQRKIDTITKVNAPTSLKIGAGAKEDSANIDMGGIDVTDPAITQKDFVFCVYSEETVGSYKIQLAHTTNIDFTYTIYKASESEAAETGGVVYVDKYNTKHYYKKDTELLGAYLNQDGETKIANDTLHDKSYGTYSSVQKNAEPLYWQSTESITPTTATGEKGFVDYYILEVSWESEAVPNDKETDMVYITAGMV